MRQRVRGVRVLGLAFGLLLVLPSAARAAPPANDVFAARHTVPAVPFEQSLTTAEATTEPNEPQSPCGGQIGKTVWYQYTPPSDVVLKADTRGSDYDTLLAVWTGADLGSLTHVGCSDDVFGFESRVLFLAEGGTTYLFQVGGFRGAAGGLHFILEPVDAGAISGIVTDQGSGMPLAGVCVDVYDADFFSISGDLTDGAGRYVVPVRSGRYLVNFYDSCDESNDHLTEWYDNRPDFQTADAVEVVGTSELGGIDAALAASCPGMGDFSGPHFIGTPGADTFVGGDEAEVFCGLDGGDRISGGGGDDFISGGDGRDRQRGGQGRDFLEGGGGGDRLSGGGKNDLMFGDEGDDRLGGGGGNDDLFGEKGSDRLGGGGGRDFCDGGKDRDRANRSCERTDEIP